MVSWVPSGGVRSAVLTHAILFGPTFINRKIKIMHWKGLLVIAVVAIVAVAVAARVGFLKNLVFGAAAPSA